MRIRAGAGLLGVQSAMIITAVLFFSLCPFSLALGETKAGEQHNVEVLRELKEFRQEVNKMNVLVVKYMAESGKDISTLLEFKKNAEIDIEELKKKPSFCG